MNQILQQRIRRKLQEVYGSRLHSVLLYGSEVRAQAAPDSDVDILVLLEGPIEPFAETRRITRALYPLQLEYCDRPLHAMPVDANEFEAQELFLYRSIKREGVAI